jgi:hypothetical protein
MSATFFKRRVFFESRLSSSRILGYNAALTDPLIHTLNVYSGDVMSEPQTSDEIIRRRRFFSKEFLVREGPYLAVLCLTVVGIALTGMARYPMTLFWDFLAPVIGFVCILIAWPDAPDRDARWRLVWRQALHWAAFLIAMNVALLPDVQRLVHPRGVALMILLQLALGTFVAGIHISSWRICFIGVAMAVGVPAIAWVERSAFAIVGLVAVVGLILAFRGTDRKKQSG